MSLADVSRWARQSSAADASSDSVDARSRLRLLCAQPKCQRMLASLQREAAAALELDPNNVSARGKLGLCAEKRGLLSAALRHLGVAAESADPDWEGHLQRVQRSMRLQSLRRKRGAAGERLPTVQARSVERVSARDLSVAEFRTRFAVPRVPVVLTHLPELEGSERFSLRGLGRALGGLDVPLQRHAPASARWARLEPAGTSRLDAFVEDVLAGAGEEQRYLHDWSLAQHAPTLADAVVRALPHCLRQDYLRAIGDERQAGGCHSLLYTRSWPSLFCGPRGSLSDLHVDACGLHFWMRHFVGRKRWTLWPHDDATLAGLGATLFEGSQDLIFDSATGADLQRLSRWDFDGEGEPECEAAKLPRWVVECRAGELLFVPAGVPHFVVNHGGPTLGVSANFVDDTNVKGFLQECGAVAIGGGGRHAEIAAAVQEKWRRGQLV